MREIKFRAFDSINKVMEYNVNVNQGKPVKKGYQWFNTGNAVYHSELMQYTGLKDKNGKEIYEGDILEEWVYPQTIKGNSSVTHIHDGKVSNKAVVRFDQERGSFDAKEIKGFWYMSLNKIEVIGNIYENTELLEAFK